jgi:hypothetical protein
MSRLSPSRTYVRRCAAVEAKLWRRQMTWARSWRNGLDVTGVPLAIGGEHCTARPCPEIT